eukprot:XP_011612807.1 PREDICTED: S100P-binding protein [Takifugu rubripes]
MAGHWHYGDVPSKWRDNGSRMPFRLKWDQVQNQGRAPGIKTRFTFDPLDAADECASQSWGPFQPILPPVPPRQAVRRVKPKEKCVSWRDLEEDEGYFSPFNKDFNAWNKPSRCVFSGSSSSPLLNHKTGFRPGSSESESHGQTPPSRQDEFLADDGHIVSGSILQPLNAAVGSLDDDRSDTGLPVLQSSMCASVRVELNCGREQKRQVSVEVQEHMLETVHGDWTTLVEQDSTLDTSYEATFRLQVKVKSVDLLPDQPTNSSGNPSRDTMDRRSEMDWAHEKRVYLDSVKKHVSGNQGGRKDVMTELLDLMTETNCPPGSSTSQPQHPSDLTSRNYQRRFRYLRPSVTLQEWQLNNCRTGKRFANVLKDFRSHCSYS